MSLNQAHAFAFSLAATLMVTIVVFRAGDGTLSARLQPAAQGFAAVRGTIVFLRVRIITDGAPGPA